MYSQAAQDGKVSPLLQAPVTIITFLFILVSCYFAANIQMANAQQKVGVELVLATDTSRSVDDGEFRLQMQGIASAFRRPEIAAAIAEWPEGGVAVSLVHWSIGFHDQLALPWRHLTNLDSILAFAAEVERVPRLNAGKGTAIGSAIDFSIGLIETNRFEGTQRKIDVSGDGRNNFGPLPHFARDRALAKNITINGLTIGNNDTHIRDYYLNNVVGGPDSFVLTVNDYDDFAQAMFLKLQKELSPGLLNVSQLGERF